MDYVKEVESGINKQNAEGDAKGPERRRQYRGTARAVVARIELKNGRTTKRRKRRTNRGTRGEGRKEEGEEKSQRNGRVLLGVERGEREGKS